MESPYSDTARQNLVGDIARWKVELEEVGGGNAYSDEDLQEYVGWLYSMSDEELRSHWNGTVAEWVASRHDMPIPEDVETEVWLDEQFEALLRGDTPPWGYSTWFEAPPESEVSG